MSDWKRLFTPLGIVVDLGLAALWFVFFVIVLRDFVPAETPLFQWFWSAVTAFCLTTVFWMALGMFRAVLMDEKLNGRERDWDEGR